MSTTPPNIPLPQEDQTLDSIAAHTSLCNGDGKPLRTIIHQRFGLSGPIGSPLAGKVPNAFRVLSGAGYATPFELLDAHSYLPLFRPFVSPQRYEAASRIVGLGHPGSAGKILATSDTALIRRWRFYCRECAMKDLRRDGFAYARRAHQVVGADYCPWHGEPLFRPCSVRGVPSEFGILTMGDMQAPSEWTVDAHQPDPLKALRLRFSRFVAAALDGSLPCLGPAQRRALATEQVSATPRGANEPHSLPHRFESIVAARAPRSWLSCLGLDPQQGSAARWPAQFIAGVALQEDPAVGLLCATILFNDPSDYREHASRHLALEPGFIYGRSTIPARGRSPVSFSVRLFRALLREPIKNVVREFGLREDQVASILKIYPSLEERRARCIVRSRIRECRRILQDYVRETGVGATRNGARRANVAAVDWLGVHDPQFLDDLLPRICGRLRRPPASSAKVRARWGIA